MELKEKDRVRKRTGYSYPGVIVSVFRNLRGETRYVVECVAQGCQGMLHIFNREQLEKEDDR